LASDEQEGFSIHF